MAPEGTGYLGLEPYDVYWSRVRDMYTPFENGMKSGTARVFDHQIPGKRTTWYLVCNSVVSGCKRCPRRSDVADRSTSLTAAVASFFCFFGRKTEQEDELRLLLIFFLGFLGEVVFWAQANIWRVSKSKERLSGPCNSV